MSSPSANPVQNTARPESRRLNALELFFDGSWTSYLAAGTAAIVLSWMLTGCRIGNRTDNGPQSSTDTITGFYSTTPASMETLILKTGQTTPTHTNPSLSLAPQGLIDLMSDPVAVAVQTASTGDTAVFSPFATPDSQGRVPYIGVTANFSTGELSKSAQYAPITFWNDANCQETDKVEVDGAVNRQGSGTVVHTYTIAGRVQLTYAFYIFLTGDCTASLNAVSACMQDVTKCLQADAATNQSQQDFWKAYYKPYIDSGLMTISDIPSVTTMAYGVLFQ